jgi:hypothetical protein
MDNITVTGRPFSPEIILEPGDMLRLFCPRTPSRAWLGNGEVIRAVSLSISSEGIYQCVGEQLTGPDETDFTGEPGSNVYILTRGTCR